MTFWARTFIHALFFPALVYLFQIATILLFDVYSYFPTFDVPMHILGGVSVAMSVFYLCQAAKKKKLLSIRSYALEACLIVIVTLSVAVWWEWYEYAVTILTNVPFQGTMADTMADLVYGTIGAATTVLLLAKKSKKSSAA
jgi:uncharacterized membrane protein YjdF